MNNFKNVLNNFLKNTTKILLTMVNDTTTMTVLIVKSIVDNLFLNLYNESCFLELKVNLNSILNIEEDEEQLVLNTSNGYITLEK